MELTPFKCKYGMAMLLLLLYLKSQKQKSIGCKLHEYAAKFIDSRKRLMEAKTNIHVKTSKIKNSNLDTTTVNTRKNNSTNASQ